MPRGGLAQLSAAALGAGLLACALPSLGLWPLAWIGLAPMMIGANASASRREAALLGFAAGLSFHAVAMHWVYETCRFAQMPLPVSALAWLSLSAVLALNWAAACALARWLSEISGSLRPWLWALCWTAVSAATEHFTPRLGVDTLAYTQWPNLSLLQAGAWGGPHLLGFALCLANAAVAEAWVDRARATLPLASAAALAAGLWAHGAWSLIQRPVDRGPAARVEILQPCVEQYRKWDAAFVDGILDGYGELLSRPRPRSPALVVWPETAIPRWVSRSEAVPEAASWALKLGAPQLVGIVARPEGGAGPANSAQLIGRGGKSSGFYAKRELVPFGEFVPLRSWVPRYVIDRWLMILDNLGDLDAGPREQALIDTAWGKTAVTICYEAMFPRWSRRDAARGASLLINITNDGWYKDTWAPHQHFRSNVFRAVENRLTVVRAGNTGISAVIDPWGAVTAELALNERGRLDADVPLEDPFPRRSFYARHGDWFGMACLSLALLATLRRAFA